MCDPNNKELSLDFLQRSFDPDDDPGNDRRVRRTVHRMYPKILNVEKHGQFLRQAGGRKALKLTRYERALHVLARAQKCVSRSNRF